MKRIIFLPLLFGTGIATFGQEPVQGRDTLSLEPFEVKAIRAGEKAPFSKSNLSKKEISRLNQGQDIPFILNQTPSVTVSSDAGTGIGYTGLRIRGTDATRINITLNGIPYNDAESQGTFFVNLPDFISSVNSIQIQRGVGTSSNGTGAFGATVSLSTNELNEKAYGELSNSYGSFNTWKNTVKAGTGLINNHFTLDTRLSRITSDGFIDRASSNLQSFYLSGAYLNKNSSLRLNIFSGKEKTYQAWNGVPESLLKTDRTYNSSGTDKPGEPYANETDNYTQTHYQLFFDQALRNNWHLNTAVFLTRGTGYYENYKGEEAFADYGLPDLVINGETVEETDLVRQKWLDNNFYGQIFSVQHKRNRQELTLGGGWSVYEGDHHGDIIWAKYGFDKDFRYYDVDASKSDINLYAKWQYQLSPYWSLFADVQYRHLQHRMNGFSDNPDLFIKRKFNFFNPKAGLTYTRNGWQAYLSYAAAGKEPNRDDFEAGITKQPRRETLHDFEGGIEKRTVKYHAAATIYYMLYKDQLVQTGMINDVGAYTRMNVPDSYRAGLELQGGYVFTDWLRATANATFSRNKIKRFTAAYDEYIDWDATGKQVTEELRNTDISFSPAITAAGSVEVVPVRNLEFSLISKYVGKQYLDNTQSENRKLNDYYTQDIRVIFTVMNRIFKEWNFIGQVNNLFDRSYESNGATYPAYNDGKLVPDNYYFPMAGINWTAGITIKF